MRFLKTAKEYNIISGLPKDFTEVEYIQSTGTQYIMSGLTMPNGFHIKGVISITDLSVTGGIFGCYTNAQPYYRNFFDYTNSKNWLIGYGGSAYQYIGSNAVNTIYNFDICNIHNKEYLKVNETEYTFTPTGSVGDYTDIEIPIFALNVSGTISNIAKMKLYRLEVYNENDVLVRNYIPCLDSSNVPCLYDKVEQKPYYNAGTNEFTYGPKIYPIEYIENTETGSSRNWINTGIVTDNTTKWEVKISYNDTNTGKLMGSGIGGDTRFNLGIESSRFRFGFGSGWFDANLQIYTPDTNPHVWILDCSTKTGTIDGYSAVSTSTFGNNTYPIALFGRANNVDSVESSNTTIGKIYYSKIWKNNILVSDMIPVRDENNAGYMFDKVTHILFGNKGSGSFTIGDDIPQYKKKYTVLFPKENPKDIPAGYTEVEYLESTGAQYIDTGYNIVTSTDEVEMTYQLMDSGTNYKWLFGEHDTNARFGLGSGDGTNKRNVAYGTGTTQIADTYFLNKPHTYKASTAGVYVDGEKKVNYSSFSSTSTLWLFSLNLSGGTYFANARIYRYSHKRNDVLLLDMIPCLDASGRPCMYDKVERKPYYNLGTGADFTYGNKIIPVEYIEASGTQYIDTSVIAKSGLSSSLDFEYTALDTTSISMLDARSSDNRFYLCHTGNANGYWFYYGYGSAIQSSVTPTVNTRYKVETTLKSGTQSMKINGTTILSGTSAATYNLNTSLYLFGINYNTPQFLAKAKLYACKIWDNDTLVRDMIPVKNENGIGYMFDKATHTLYGNSGTGEFICGKGLTVKSRMLLDDNSIPHAYAQAKYIQSTGTQWINSGIQSTINTKVDLKFAKTKDTVQDIIVGNKVNDSNDFRFFCTMSSTTTYLIFDMQASRTYTTKAESLLNQVMNVSIDKTEMVIDGTSYSISNVTDVSAVDIGLFGGYQSSGVYCSDGIRIYKCKIWDGSTLVRDFVPVIRRNENKPGLWDKVNKVFYTNQASSGNDFIVGF